MRETENKQNLHPDQVNPGQKDRFGNEVVIKKNEGISEQGNEWSDEEGINVASNNALSDRAEKYMRESGNIEDLPGGEENDEADQVIKKENSNKNNIVDDDDNENADDVIEDKVDPGRNKVQ